MGGWNGTGKDNKGDMSLVEMASSNPKVYNRIQFSKEFKGGHANFFLVRRSKICKVLGSKTKSNLVY
jgi:hypothetical protein